MGKKLSISISATDALVYYNCWVQEAINASSLNYSLRCNNGICFQQAGMHAHAHATASRALGWAGQRSQKNTVHMNEPEQYFSLTPISWNSILVYFPVLPNRPFVAT